MRSSSRWRRAGVRALVIGLLVGISLSTLVGSAIADPSTTDYRTTKDEQASTEAGPMIEPGEDEAIDLFPPRSAVSAPAPGRTCPATWLFFSNNVMNYDLCYPPTWGFNDGSSTNPMASLVGSSLYGLQMMSAEAFPWVVGSDPVAVAAARNAVVLDAEVYQPHVGLPKGCTPTTAIPVVGASATWCGEYVKEVSGDLMPDPNGKLYLAKFLIPLATDPLKPGKEVDTTGYELVLTALTSRTGWANLSQYVLDIVRNTRPL